MSLPNEEIFFGSMLPPRRALKLNINKTYMNKWNMQTCVKHMFTIHKVVLRQETTQRIIRNLAKPNLLGLTIPTSPSKSFPINTSDWQLNIRLAKLRDPISIHHSSKCDGTLVMKCPITNRAHTPHSLILDVIST